MKAFRGDIWLVDLNPVRGHEQAGVRPALILSVNIFNNGPAGLIIVAPLTTKDKGIPLHVQVSQIEGGLPHTGYIQCEDLRSIAKERLTQRLGSVSFNTLAQVEDRVRILMGL